MLLSQGIRELVIGVVVLVMYFLHWGIYGNSRYQFRKGLAGVTLGGGLGYAFSSLMDYWSIGVWNRRLLMSVIFLCLIGVMMHVLARKKIAAK